MLCECGCGQDAGVYGSTNRPRGMVKGQPKRFLKGHHNKFTPKTYHKKTHCKRGHALTEENRDKRGKCKRCKNDKSKQQRSEWKSKGLCQTCGKFPPDEGATMCVKCRQAHRKNCNRRHKVYSVELAEAKRSRRRKLRLSVLTHYSNGTPQCACCGESMLHFLCIDHINGGGSKHRREGKFPSMYQWLKTHNFPEGFQVLCHNCNMAKFIYGVCPHREQQDNQIKDV